MPNIGALEGFLMPVYRPDWDDAVTIGEFMSMERPTVSYRQVDVDDASKFGEVATGRGYDVRSQQVGKGPFQARIQVGSIGSVSVSLTSKNRPLLTTGEMPRNRFVLLGAVSGEPVGRFNGVELQPGALVVAPPGTSADLRSDPGFVGFSLFLPPGRVIRAATQCLDFDVTAAALYHIDPHFMDRLSRLVFSGMSLAQDPHANWMWLVEWESQVHVTVLRMFEDANARPLLGRPSLHHRVQYARAARDYIEAHLDEPLRLDSLYRAVGVSPRTIAYSFEDLYGMSPMSYVRIRRLHEAKHRLLSGSSASVTEVALSLGFEHLGRFAAYYRQLFGVPPSETRYQIAC